MNRGIYADRILQAEKAYREGFVKLMVRFAGLGPEVEDEIKAKMAKWGPTPPTAGTPERELMEAEFMAAVVTTILSHLEAKEASDGPTNGARSKAGSAPKAS